MTEQASTTVIVLAAGEGTRMRSRTPKVLHAVGGRTLLGHALETARAAEPERVVAVVGHGREQVEPYVRAVAPGAVLAVQAEQNGTGHAVQVALDALPAAPTGTVVVTYADVPLLTGRTLQDLVGDHERSGCAVSILTARPEDPTGYGRVVRGRDGGVEAIVEHKDASAEQRAINEVNAGIYAFDAVFLVRALGQVGTDNVQGEVYLTDVVEIAHRDGLGVSAHVVADAWQTEGVNDRVQLARLGAELNRRTLHAWMRDGVTVVDPASTWVDVTVTLARDVTLHPGTQLHGSTTVDEGAEVGPDSTLSDVSVGSGARIVRTHADEAVVDSGAQVGPFAYLRPGTRLRAGGKIGTFVETKKADIGEGSKVPHLSYVGDAVVGEQSNIGAATIFANYDGVEKHATTVGRHCRTGSDNIFVAPVTIGDGAFTGAGTTVRADVPPGALAVSGGPQRNIDGWVESKRPGTAAAEAAQHAREQETDQ